MRRKSLPIVAAFLGAVAMARGETGLTALGAVKLLPKEAAAKLALIEAFEGKPLPERWHILVHDPKEESGVHEYVVAGGEVVASRSVSQFADELKPEDVIGADALKIDSDRAAKLAQQYAQANKLAIAAYNYELKKDGEGAAALWHVNCLDDKGESLGKIVLTATKGAVVSHDGFAAAPGREPAKVRVASRTEERRPPAEVRRAEPAPLPPLAPSPYDDRPGFFHRTLRNLFPGGDAGPSPREVQPRPR